MPTKYPLEVTPNHYRASPDVGNIRMSIKSSSESDPRQLGHHDDGDGGGGSLDKISDQLLMTSSTADHMTTCDYVKLCNDAVKEEITLNN